MQIHEIAISVTEYTTPAHIEREAAVELLVHLRHKALRELVLEHDNRAAEERPVRQELERKGRRDLVPPCSVLGPTVPPSSRARQVRDADVEGGELRAQRVAIGELPEAGKQVTIDYTTWLGGFDQGLVSREFALPPGPGA